MTTLMFSSLMLSHGINLCLSTVIAAQPNEFWVNFYGY
ncbi:hypothetical protein SynBOUM118_00531 [Synechococcus sp. BOUM118]|nr:hypothetical protein SynBOUM118_00531 [Synechococcus sp. BOUM118]